MRDAVFAHDMINKGALILIIIVTAIAIVYSAALKATTCRNFECLVIYDKSLWQRIVEYEQTDKAWRGLIYHPLYRIRLEKIGTVNSDDADALSKINRMKIESTFVRNDSPYPGAISNKVVCGDEFIPKVQKIVTTSGMEVNYYSAFLNNRLQYGSCTEEQNLFRSYSAFFYCQNTQEWYQVEIIVPEDNGIPEHTFKKIFSNIYCQRPSVNIGRLLP